MPNRPFHMSTDSLNDLVELSREKRRGVLITISVVAALCLLGFGVSHLLSGNYTLALILLSSLLVGSFFLWIVFVKNRGDGPALWFLNGIATCLLIAFLLEGTDSPSIVLWIAPVAAFSFITNSFTTGLRLGMLNLLIFLALLFSPLADLFGIGYSPTESLRILVTYITLGFLCLASVYHDEQANEVMLFLHNSDLEKRANSDQLTGLSNRWSFSHMLSRVIERSVRDQTTAGLMMIDLDNFKQVNDKYGHLVGDRLLVEFSRRLTEMLRPTDISATLPKQGGEAARLAGDEFAVILSDINVESLAGIADRLLSLFDGGFEIGDTLYHVNASIGITTFPHDGNTAEDLLDRADIAMYRAKSEGKGRYRFFTEEIEQEIQRKLSIEDGIRRSLNGGEFELVYMPIFEGKTLRPVRAEALLRTSNPNLAGIGPAEFIPVAENSGLILDIDRYVAEKACSDLVELERLTGKRGRVSINLSSRELQNRDLPDSLTCLLEKYRISPEQLEIELTESALTDSDNDSIAILQRLKDIGFSIALDDFGTGYIAFNQLINYPVDSLKIDRSFVTDLQAADPIRNNLAEYIHNLARLYRLDVVAEGVETQTQVDHLNRIGCDYLQGYFLSKPLSFNDYVSFVKRSMNDPAEAEVFRKPGSIGSRDNKAEQDAGKSLLQSKITGKNGLPGVTY